jgi:hypothetical protein
MPQIAPVFQHSIIFLCFVGQETQEKALHVVGYRLFIIHLPGSKLTFQMPFPFGTNVFGPYWSMGLQF